MTGTCTVILKDAGGENEHVEVVQADPVVLASPELVRQWLNGEAPHVTVEDGIARFGTHDEGMGVVAYRIGDIPTEVDVTVFAELKPSAAHYVTLTRVEP